MPTPAAHGEIHATKPDSRSQKLHQLGQSDSLMGVQFFSHPPILVRSVMRVFTSSLLFFFGLSIVGCGESTPQTVDSSAIESYVTDNPEAVAQEEALAAEEEAAEEDD